MKDISKFFTIRDRFVDLESRNTSPIDTFSPDPINGDRGGFRVRNEKNQPKSLFGNTFLDIDGINSFSELFTGQGSVAPFASMYGKESYRLKTEKEEGLPDSTMIQQNSRQYEMDRIINYNTPLKFNT